MVKRNSCPGCGGGESEAVFEAPYSHSRIREHISKTHPDFDWQWVAGESYVIRHCPSCGALFQENVWTPKGAEQFYNLASHGVYQERPLKLSSLAHMAQEVMLMRLLVKEARPRVLDYGMGWGNWASMALAFGCDVDGFEVNTQACLRAKARGIRVITADGLPRDTYDFINVDQVLEHLAEPSSLLELLVPALRPGGLMLLGVPGHSGALRSYRRAAATSEPMLALSEKDLDALSPLVHLTLFNGRSLRRVACRAGLRFFRPPLGKTLASGTLWNSPRQWNRNLYLPIKFWLGNRTRLWFHRPIGRPGDP